MKRVCLTTFFTVWVFIAFAQDVQVGFLTDFKLSPRTTEITAAIQAELQRTIGANKQVKTDPTRLMSCDWDVNTAAEKYRQLVRNCDLIVVLGATATKGALQTQPFSVPTLALGVIDPELQGVPITEEYTSGIPNFSYVLSAPNLKGELTTFKEIKDFKHLVILVDQRTSGIMDEEKGRERIKGIREEFGIEVDILPVTDDIAGSLDAMPVGADAVYLGIPYERSREDVERIAEGLIAKKLPSFAMNKTHVDAGMLGCLSDENGFSQIVRKLSIMADDVLSGQALEEMSVKLHENNELFFNLLTARKIGLSPSFSTMFTANIVGDPGSDVSQNLSLEEVIATALEENLDIKSSEQDRLLADMDVKFAKSGFLPDASLTVNGSQVSKNITNPLTGQSERTVAGQVGVQQLIFSEQARANITISNYLNQAQDFATKQVINDLIYDCYLAYFSILKSKTNITIQQENLEASKKNLELAQIRAKVGYSSNADIFRWQSEVATAKQQVIEAHAGLSLAKMQLYVYLNGAIDEDFDVQDAELEDSSFVALENSGISEFVKGPVEYIRMTEFLIQEAQENFPAKLQLATNESILERQRQMYKRLYYLPNLAASAQVNSTLYRGGENSQPLPGSEFINNHWNVALSLSYPIFNQNSRKLNIQNTEIQRQQLDYQLNSLDQNLRLGVTQRTLALLTAQTNILYSRVSAENIAESFDLIQTAYRQGQASVTQLVDAQRAKIQAQQAYALSLYEYMEAYIGLENQIGFYSSLSTREEREAFKQRITAFLLNSDN